MLNPQVIESDPWQLGWHLEWFLPTVEWHAQAAFVEAHDLDQEPAESVWRRVGSALLADVHDCMSSTETPDFIIQARVLAADLYLRRLQQLVSTSPIGGRA